MNNREIYVVLIKAMTGLGRFARRISGYDYTHTAVCLDSSLDDFVTFSRRRHSAPFDAGFMHERREHYAFGKYDSVKVKVFRIPVSDEVYERVKNFAAEIENDEQYVFNLFSMATMPVIHGFKIYKTYNCMSFVGRIIELSEAVCMDRKYYKYTIKELDLLLDCFEHEEIILHKDKEDTAYMAPVNIFKNIGQYIKLNTILTYRLIFKSMVKF